MEMDFQLRVPLALFVVAHQEDLRECPAKGE